MTEAARPVERPLSPHLSIYRFYITMTMSIVHRITGAALYFGTLILAWWLIAAAAGPGPFGFVTWLMGTWFGLLVLFGFTWALIHHMLGGIRHLIWDLGIAIDKESASRLAWATIVGSLALTILVWIVVFAVR
jgi:succinate dehydrogenase / fumarate reductase cytochrome b subunit